MSVDAVDVHRRWRAIAKLFPLWRFGIDLFFDVNSWRMIGADVTSMLVSHKNARRAAEIIQGATPEAIEALAAIAKVNESRSSDLFRAVFLGYVTVPIALAAMLSDAAPDFLNAFVREYSAVIMILLLGTLVFPIVYFCGNWRAKQIAWVVELHRVGAIVPLEK